MTKPLSLAGHARLQYLGPAWFGTVMGLSGLSLAWFQAAPLLGSRALDAAWAVGALAVLWAVALVLLSVVRAHWYPIAWRDDLTHPVRHPFVAAIPVSALLVSTVLTVVMGASVVGRVVWLVGALSQLVTTVWVIRRWLHAGPRPGLLPFWPGVTPVMLIPVVGNVLVPLAGVPLGMSEWSAAQMGIGVLFWPVLLTLLCVRLAEHGLWPERLLPATFITVAPPAVIGLSLLQLGAPVLLAWACWGMGLFFVLWSFSLFKRVVAQPFGIPFWGMSFPLAAMAGLTLKLAVLSDAGWVAALAMVFLALVTVLIGWLVMGTVKGLLNGHLLVAEPVTAIPLVSDPLR
jgi:tellurite resistance protein